MATNATQVLLTRTLERQLRQQQLANQIANRRYEGDITGPEDTVKILVPQAANVTDHVPGTQTTIQTNVDATPATMPMDHAKDFAFLLDGAENLEQFAEEFAGETFAEVLEEADKFILTNASSAGNTFDFDASVATPDLDELFGQAREVLDNEGVPQIDRVAVVPPVVKRLVYKDIKERDTSLGDQTLATGAVGNYYGFRVFSRPESFFTTTGTGEIESMFGSRFYQTYGDAVVTIQIINDAVGYTGGTVIQGLHVAGSVLTQPKGWVSPQITTP